MSDNLEEREEVVGDAETFGRIQSYNRKMLSLFLVLFYAAGPLVVSFSIKEYGFAENVSWVFVILAGFTLSLIVSDEFSLQKFGAKILRKGKFFTVIDAISRPDELRRAVFHQRLQAFLLLFFVLPATMLSSLQIILNWTDIRKFAVVLGIWFLFGVVSVKITDWIAVKKFGEVEKKEQEEKKAFEQERRKILTSSGDYKKRAYLKKTTAVYIMAYMLLFLIPVSMAEHAGIPKTIILPVTIGAVLLLANFTAQKKADKKFPSSASNISADKT
jgi:hypothetical protein